MSDSGWRGNNRWWSPPRKAARASRSGPGICFRLEWCNALRLDLVLEAVDEVFFGEIAGRLGLIAEQVAYCMVVMTVRQPARTVGAHRAAMLGLGDSFACLAHLFVERPAR